MVPEFATVGVAPCPSRSTMQTYALGEADRELRSARRLLQSAKERYARSHETKSASDAVDRIGGALVTVPWSYR